MSAISKHFRSRWPHIAVIALAVAAVSVGYISGRNSPIHTTTADAIGENAISASSEGSAKREPTPQVLRAEAALPAPNTPLRSTFDELRTLSAAGDAKAAMRLFDDLTACSKRKRHMRGVNQLSFNRTERIQRFGPSTHNDKSIDQSLGALEVTDNLCEGITQEQIDMRGEALRRAALLGDPTALVCYAASVLYTGPEFLSDSWFAYAERWKSEAPEFARRAFDKGQANVVPLLLDAYMPQVGEGRKSFELSQLIAPNPQLAFALASLYARLVPESDMAAAQASAEGLRAGLTPKEIDAAEDFVLREWPRFESQAGSPKNLVPCPDVSVTTD
jgi:hypothetical protein